MLSRPSTAHVARRPSLVALAALLLAAAVLLASFDAAQAQGQGELPPELEARAAALYDGLMCVQCAGQTISQSRSPVAASMRETVRQRLLAGDTDAQIYDLMVAAYGESVLASPPIQGAALAVWLVPPVVLLLGMGAVVLVVRRLRSPRAPMGRTRAPGDSIAEPNGSVEAYLRLVDTEMAEGRK